jgi:hypothetical protein
VKFYERRYDRKISNVKQTLQKVHEVRSGSSVLLSLFPELCNMTSLS